MTTTLTKVDNHPLQVWERLRLVVDEDGQEGVYYSHVADIRDDRLVIGRPIFEHGSPLLSEGSSVSVSFAREDASYAFTAQVTEAKPNSPDFVWLVERDEIKRFQRRDFIRLELNIPLKYKLLPSAIKDKPLEPDDIFEITRTINFSAAGVLFPVDEKVAAHSLMLLDFSLCSLAKMPRYVISLCRQVHREQNQESKVAGVEFILSERLFRYLKPNELALFPDEAKRFDARRQNALVHELFVEQTMRRQKGWL